MTRRRILIVSPVGIEPVDWGCKARVAQLVVDLEAMGHEVFFLHVDDVPTDRSAMRARFGPRLLTAPYRHPEPPHPAWLIREAERRGKILGDRFRYLEDLDAVWDARLDTRLVQVAEEVRPDVVLAEYVFYSRALEAFGPGARKLLDTHDLFVDRHELFWDLGLPAQFYSTSASEEQRGFERADGVLAIQEEEGAQIAKRVDRPVYTVAHTPRPQPLLPACHDGAPQLLFVGSGNSLNTDGAREFVTSVLPLVRKSRPDVTLLLAGGVCDMLEIGPVDGVHRLGTVPDLVKVYDRAHVVINPVRVGTGLHVKNMEALALGRPLVLTPAAARGMGDAGAALRIAASPEAFADQILGLLGDPAEASRVVEAGLAHLQRWARQSYDALGAAVSGSPIDSR